MSAGEALPREIGERFTAHFGCEILDGIGSTEMLHIFLSNRAGRVRYGTTGMAVPGYDVELRGEDGRPVADGEIGDLYIRGPSAALMYWTNRDKSRATFQGEWTQERRQVRRDARRLLRLRRPRRRHAEGQRHVRVAVRGRGRAVAHPAVLEAAVIGREDAEGLTKTKAYVVLKAGGSETTPADLLRAIGHRKQHHATSGQIFVTPRIARLFPPQCQDDGRRRRTACRSW